MHFYELGGAGTLFVNDQREVQERRSRASQGTLTTAERTPVCTLNRRRTIVSGTWKYDDPRLKMSHEGAFSCPTNDSVIFCRMANYKNLEL